MLNNNLNIVLPIIYENYITQQHPKLYINLDVNLSYEWDTKKIRAKKKRRRKPTNFKKLYKRLYFLNRILKVVPEFSWNIIAPKTVFTKIELNILEIDSYFLRTLNNSVLYNHQSTSKYKAIKLKGFTSDKDKVFEKRLLSISKELKFSQNKMFKTKISKQKTLENSKICISNFTK